MEETFPVVRLDPVQIPGRTEMARELVLKYTVKVGRAVANKVKPTHTNAIFDSKVLSRSHAEIWADKGKVYIQDTKSSNGTYLDDRRLSAGGKSSEPEELKSGMVLKLGVDVTENHQASHKCVTLRVTVVNPAADEDQDAAKAKTETWIPVPALIEQGEAAITSEITALRTTHGEQQSKLAQLGKTLNEVTLNEKTRTQQLQNLTMVLDRLETGAEESHCDFLQEDKLLSRIDAMESQLKYYMARYPSQEDEMEALRQGAFEASNAKFEHEMYSKALFKRTEDEKAELFQRLQQLKADRANTFNSVEVQLHGRQKEIDDLKQERTELLGRFQDLQNSATSLVEKMKGQQDELAASKSANEGLANLAAVREASGDGLMTPRQPTDIPGKVAGAPSDTVVDADATVPATTSAVDGRIATLATRIEELENEVQLDQVPALEVKIKALETQLDAQAAELQAKTAELAVVAAALTGAKISPAAPAGVSVDELEALKDEADDLRGENEVAQGEIKYLKDMLKASKEEVRKAELESLATTKTVSAQVDELLESLRGKESALADAQDEVSAAKDKLAALVEEVTDAKKAVESSAESAKDAEKLRADVTRLKSSLSEKDSAVKALEKAAKASKTAQQVLQKKLDQADKFKAKALVDVKAVTEATRRAKREKSELFQKIEFESKAHKTTQQKLQVLERTDSAVHQFREEATHAKADAAALQTELEQVTSRVAELEAEATKVAAAAAGGGGSGMQSVIGFVCGSVAAAVAAQMVAANSEE